jgi:hypothetical protein
VDLELEVEVDVNLELEVEVDVELEVEVDVELEVEVDVETEKEMGKDQGAEQCLEELKLEEVYQDRELHEEKFFWVSQA